MRGRAGPHRCHRVIHIWLPGKAKTNLLPNRSNSLDPIFFPVTSKDAASYITAFTFHLHLTML